MLDRRIIILIFFFSLFYLQNRYAILSIDDWLYAFMVDEQADNYKSVTFDDAVRTPVNSFHDALLSQSRDYFKTNGRFIIHSIVQYFCGTKTMQQFVIINSMVFALFTLLTIKLIDRRLNTWNLLLLLSAIWILLPHKGLTFMGNISLSVNYLWTATASLLFITILEKTINHSEYPLPAFITFTVYALVAGSLQESFSIGISGALLIYLIWKRKTVTKKILILAIAYMIGSIVCVMSPANFNRTDDIGGIGFHINSLLGILSSPPCVLFFITCVILKSKLIQALKENYLIIVPALINLAFVFLIAYNGRHQLTAVNVFIFIFLFRIWLRSTTENLQRKVAVVLLTVALISYLPILSARRSYYQSYMSLVNRIQTSESKIVSGSEFESNTERIKRNPILECNYITTFTFADWDFYEQSLSIYLTKGKDNKLVEEITN